MILICKMARPVWTLNFDIVCRSPSCLHHEVDNGRWTQSNLRCEQRKARNHQYQSHIMLKALTGLALEGTYRPNIWCLQALLAYKIRYQKVPFQTNVTWLGWVKRKLLIKQKNKSYGRSQLTIKHISSLDLDFDLVSNKRLGSTLPVKCLEQDILGPRLDCNCG